MRLPWIAASGTVVVLACGVVLDALSGHGTGAGSIVGWTVATVVSSGFGYVLATRRREQPVVAKSGVSVAATYHSHETVVDASCGRV